MKKVPVLIVGGGPVGLALAGELGWRGIACTLIEQGDGTIVTPKMNEVNIRTMEFCRRWGIADAVHACPFPPDYPLDVAFVTSLSGYELGRMPRPPRMSEAPEPHSPMRLQVCSQMWFDPILQQLRPHVSAREPALPHAARIIRGFRKRRDARRSSISKAAGASASRPTISSGATARTAWCAARSASVSTARRSAIPCISTSARRTCWRLAAASPRPSSSPSIVDGAWSNVRVIDPVNAMWRLMVLDAGPGLTPETVDREAYLRRALGRPLEVEWLGTSVWTRRSVGCRTLFEAAASSWRATPCINCRRPARLGMNTGIADAVDLGWKLAAVLARMGWRGPAVVLRRRAAADRRTKRPHGRRVLFRTREIRRWIARDRGGQRPRERKSRARGRSARARRRPDVPHHRTPDWLPLRGLADLRPRRHAALSGRPGRFRAFRASRFARAACVARRRPLDPRSLWARLRAASARRRCTRCVRRSKRRRRRAACRSRPSL